MNFVVLAASKGVSRMFYAERYEEGKDIKPACWSAEGDKPATDVPNPQHSNCAGCPQNIEGSGEGKSRACRYSKRLAVALENDIEGNIYRLQVPAKSYFGKAEGDKMPLQAFGKFLAGHGIPITGIVTEARFDTSEAVPVLKFRAVRPLTREEWEVAKVAGASDEARQAVEFRMVPSRAEAGAPALPSTFSQAKAEPPAPPKFEDTPEPVKRPAKKEAAAAPAKDVRAILDDWGSDDA
jgi:hypothetical protein